MCYTPCIPTGNTEYIPTYRKEEIMNHKIKRNIAAGVLTFSLAASLVPGNEAAAAPYRISKKKVTLTAGKTCTLKIKGRSGKVTWKSSNKKVATVNKKGVITAKKAGTAKITAKIRSRKLTCKITVKRPSVSQKPSVTQKPAIPQKPSTPVETPSSGSSVTEKNAYTTLNSLRSTYPEGMPLTNSYYYRSPVFGNGYGCYGFAAKLSDTVFGTQKSYKTHSSFDKIKVGDNIRIGNYHSVIVLTKEANHVTVVEGNYNSSVHWDRKITASSLAPSGFTVYTRY